MYLESYMSRVLDIPKYRANKDKDKINLVYSYEVNQVYFIFIYIYIYIYIYMNLWLEIGSWPLWLGWLERCTGIAGSIPIGPI
jgi:hypothetical protein